MSHPFRIRHIRHPLVPVLVALIPLVLLLPRPQQDVPTAVPPTPALPAVWQTAVPSYHAAVPVDPTSRSVSPSAKPTARATDSVLTEPTASATEFASAAATVVAGSSSDSNNEFSVYLPHLTYSQPSVQPAQITALRAQDDPSCLEYRDVRITWYELGSCCNKTPDHPAYGITRSGLTVQWGMAAVQAETPLVPLGTTVMIEDLGPSYPMVVADTGSETAFGSAWLDIYAPSKEIGYWLEQQIGRDLRSDVLVCPTSR